MLSLCAAMMNPLIRTPHTAQAGSPELTASQHISKPASFDVSGYEISTYVVDKGNEAVIAPLKAKELVNLDGIATQAPLSPATSSNPTASFVELDAVSTAVPDASAATVVEGAAPDAS